MQKNFSSVRLYEFPRRCVFREEKYYIILLYNIFIKKKTNSPVCPKHFSQNPKQFFYSNQNRILSYDKKKYIFAVFIMLLLVLSIQNKINRIVLLFSISMITHILFFFQEKLYNIMTIKYYYVIDI